VWSFGPEIQAIFEKYIRVREALRPYLRETMDAVRDDGGPVMRTLFYEFPDDEAAWDVSDQFLLGSHLLVAPIVHGGALSRRVYLPAGATRRDLHSGAVHQGGATVDIEAPLDTIPVFARDGALAGISL
jgi:alpha-D-xyloside xylohydrolase